MIVNNVNPSYYDNYVNSKSKNFSFGKLVPNDTYKKLVTERNADEQVRQLADIIKERINLKKLLKYDSQPASRKKLIDEYLSYLPEEQKGDLKINLDVFSYLTHLNYQNGYKLRDKVTLETCLPKYDPLSDSYAQKQVDLGFDIDTFSRPFRGRNCNEMKEMIAEAENEHRNKLGDYGFDIGRKNEYSDYNGYSVPTMKIFDYIANKINKILDDIEGAKKDVIESKNLKNAINAREEQMRNLFN